MDGNYSGLLGQRSKYKDDYDQIIVLIFAFFKKYVTPIEKKKCRER
jgi:hypothetical protein